VPSAISLRSTLRSGGGQLRTWVIEDSYFKIIRRTAALNPQTKGFWESYQTNSSGNINSLLWRRRQDFEGCRGRTKNGYFGKLLFLWSILAYPWQMVMANNQPMNRAKRILNNKKAHRQIDLIWVRSFLGPIWCIIDAELRAIFLVVNWSQILNSLFIFYSNRLNKSKL
jgi:hypothetical protein